MWSDTPGYEINEVRTHYLRGQTIGEQIGSTQQGSIKGIFPFGKNEPFYADLVTLFRAYTFARTRAAVVLNENLNPTLVIDVLQGSTQQDKTLYNPDGTVLQVVPTLKQKGKVVETSGQGGETPPALLEWQGVALERNQEELERLVREIHLTTGIPSQASGVGAAAQESGAAREQLLYSLIIKIENTRRWLEDGLNYCLPLAGAPEGKVRAKWSTTPLTPKAEIVDTTIKLYTAGLISVDEARTELKWPTAEEAGVADELVTQREEFDAAQETKVNQPTSDGSRA